MLFIGTLLALFIIFINTTFGSIGGEKKKGDENREVAALETALMKMEGIGEVFIYFHYEHVDTSSSLADILSVSGSSPKKASSLQGILVVAEGVDNSKKKNELTRILSAVLQLPEHRIVIVEHEKRGIQLESE